MAEAKKFRNMTLGAIDTAMFGLFPALREMVENHNPSEYENLEKVLYDLQGIVRSTEKNILRESGHLPKRVSFFLDRVKLPVTKCKKPSFKNVRGRTWDSGTIKIDGKEYNAHLDTTWGEYVYFQYGPENKWHKVKMQSDGIQDLQGKSFDVDPFAHPKVEIITK